MKNAQSSEILGKDHVTGLKYTDNKTGETNQIDVEGVFVQIGLLPNTEWLEGAIDTNNQGEIIVDRKQETSMPGVFCCRRCNR